MFPKKRFGRLYMPFVLIALLFSSNVAAQTRKSAPARKTVAKKSVKPTKDARKDSKKTQLAKKTAKKDPKKEKALAKARDAKKSKEKLTAKEKSRKKDSKKKDTRKSAAERRAEAARKKAEEARRQAALAEQRRREQAAREARARKLAFERGLRNQTAENILNDKIDGEDLNIRRAAVDAIGTRAGTVVVMEAKTGKIVTIVNQDWAIRNSFKPCSTIKLITGVGGINEKIINEEGGIGNSTSGLGLDAALARSNNGYFQRVGINMGSTKMIGYAKALGLGEKTGINAEGETAGRLPFGNNNARIYSHGDDFEVTPLQLAVMVSAISNGGKKVVPQIPRPRTERTSFRPHIREQVDLPQQNVQGVLPGMIEAAEYGTARRGVDAAMGVAGKTGSCIGKGSWVGLFASVAPVEDPEYAVVVITRGEGERGKYAAAIAGKVYQALSPRLRRNPEKFAALRQIAPRTYTGDLDAAAHDEEDDDEAMAESAAERSIVVGAAPKAASGTKKIVQKTTQSKPAFSPVVIEFDKDKAVKQRPRIVKN